jgi:predicted phosphate transport protein (TIGR00153 family)
MSWFRNPLKPRQDLTVTRLINQSEACVAGLQGLVDFVRAPSESKAAMVREAEERGDEERRMLINELNRTFVTPIDREDLFALSRAIDDVLDYAYTSVDEMLLFKLQATPLLIQMAELLHSAGKEIHRAMQRILEHSQVANEHAVRAKQIENHVEKVYREAIAQLFTAKVETVDGVLEILKLREVYRHLSNAADRADTAANIITDVIMKVM